MAKVIKKGSRFQVVNSVNGVPVGTPNTFSSRSKAMKRASNVKCKVMGVCKRRR